VGLFDWLGRRRSDPTPDFTPRETWKVRREGDEIVVQQGNGPELRLPQGKAQAVRIVPLTGGNHHASARGGGWQVALSQSEGDVLVGKPIGDWRSAQALAQELCEATELPFDELTERMFSRVGQVKRV
jgi:hypothetical protein